MMTSLPEDVIASSIDSQLQEDAEYVYVQRLRHLMHDARRDAPHHTAEIALLQRVREMNQQTRSSLEYRTQTNSLIRDGLTNEQRLSDQWRAAEAKARSVNRSAERAALRDVRDTVHDMYMLHRTGRHNEIDEKQRELKQHLDEANAARASRKSLYATSTSTSTCLSNSPDIPRVPKSRRELRIDMTLRKHQGENVIVVSGDRAPLYDATPDVDEFNVNVSQSINHRIAGLHGFRDADAPSCTLPHTLPRSIAHINQQHNKNDMNNNNTKPDHDKSCECIPASSLPTMCDDAQIMTISDDNDRFISSLPSINQSSLHINSVVNHIKPFSTTPYQAKSSMKASSAYRSKLPLFTQSEGDAMLHDICLFTVNQSRDQLEALELERQKIDEQDRALKAQWVIEEQRQKLSKLIEASKTGLVDLSTDPVYAMLNSYHVQPSERDSKSIEYESKECTTTDVDQTNRSLISHEHEEDVDEVPQSLHRLRPSSCCSSSQVQFERPLTSSGRPSSSRTRAASSASHSRPVTQANRVFPVAQVKSRWQHTGGGDQLTRRFNQPNTNKSRPGTSLSPAEHALSVSSSAVAFANDPLHSNFLREQRAHRAHATAAVLDTVKTWIEQQEETRKRRVSWEAAQSSEPVKQSSMFQMDTSSPFDALLNQSQLTPRTLKRQLVNFSRAPLSSSNSAVFSWLRKHRLAPRRTVKPDEEIRYRNVFSELDMDSSGMLDEQELLTAIQSTHSLTLSQDEMRMLLTAMDIRFDGKLSFTQFVTQFASISEWEALFVVWCKRREERMVKNEAAAAAGNTTMRSSRKSVSSNTDSSSPPQPSARRLTSSKPLVDDVGDVLVPFLLWLPAFSRLRLLNSLMALQLTPQEEAALKQQAHFDTHTASHGGLDRPPTGTGGLSLLDLWRVTRTQVKRKRIEADAVEAATMQQVMHVQEQQQTGKTAAKLSHEPSSSEQLEEVLRELDHDRAHRGRRAVREHVADRAFRLFVDAVEGDIPSQQHNNKR